MPPSTVESAAMAKVTRRILPFLCVCFLFAFLDRVNVGFAALEMQGELGFSDTVYSLGAGMFFVGYFVFEVPSNLILERVGARLWIARIMIVWGALSSAMMFVSTETEFYVLRFLLGAAEAGFFPGIVLYLTYWFPTAHRSRTIALFMTAPALAGVVGGPLSGALLDHHPAGMSGWQWLFLIEGIPSVALGIATLFVLPNGPREVSWLDPGQKEWLEEGLRTERRERERLLRLSTWAALAHPRVWLLALIYFLLVIGAYGFDLFMPKILAQTFPGMSRAGLGFVAAIPPFVAVLVMVAWGRRSDRLAERRWHVAWPALWASLGLIVASLGVAPVLAIGAMALAVSGRWAAIPPFWGLPTAFLSGSAAAAGIALINAIGNLGGFAGPLVMGVLKDWSGSYAAGLLVLSGCYVMGALLALRVASRPAVQTVMPTSKV